MYKANKKLASHGLTVPNRLVLLKIAIPLFQAATVEDDDDLQNIWANLLINAADKDSGIEVTQKFISILQDLSYLEVNILETIYSKKLPQDTIIWTYDLPEKVLQKNPKKKIHDQKKIFC